MDHSNMDHSNMAMTSAMSGTMPTATMSMPSMASSTGAPKMDMGGMGKCKISMLWNWNTVNSCFISSSWRITSNSMFAGSCIGVILLVIALEFLRRAGKEYDRYIVAQYNKSLLSSSSAVAGATSSSSSSDNGASKSAGATITAAAASASTPSVFRPTIVQQSVRALLHMLQFAVAYFVMLLAMYYNGYLIICIFIGAYIGYFIFGWEGLSTGAGGRDRLQENATVCCG